MNLNDFYTISYNDYKNKIKFRDSDLNLLERLNDKKNEISIRIYVNKKLKYRFSIFNNEIFNLSNFGYGDYVKFNLINIKKDILEESLKLLDSDDKLNHALFLEIFKIKLNESIQM